jgi:hypothetical protein
MITSLSKLVDQIEEGSVPAWLRQAVQQKKEEIVQQLRANGSYILTGPNGERVTITAKREAAAAA